MQADQLLDAIPRLFEGSQASEAATGAAISAAVDALKVADKFSFRRHSSCQFQLHPLE